MSRVFLASGLVDVILSILGFILEPEGSILGPFRAPGGPWGLPGETLGPKRRPREKMASTRDFLPPPPGPHFETFSEKMCFGGVFVTVLFPRPVFERFWCLFWGNFRRFPGEI